MRTTNNKDAGITLVTGGTGKTGRRAAERLRQSGVRTRIGSRGTNPRFDWNDETTWVAALEGVTRVYISYAPDLAIPGATATIRAFVDLAVKQGVRRLVLLSGRGEEEAQACEAIVQREEIEWTIVRASWFSQNFSEGEFLAMVSAGEVALPAGNIGEPFVDVNDIADVVVAALTEEGHAGQVYEVTGPRLLTFAQAIRDIASATGREVRYMQIPHEAFAAGISRAGLPEDVIWLLNYLFSTVLDGRNAHVCDGVKRALGREPTDFSEFVSRMAAAGVWNSDANLMEIAS